MVSTLERVGLFDGVDIEGFFDDQNERFITSRIGVEWRDLVVFVDEGEGFRAGFDAGMEIF